MKIITVVTFGLIAAVSAPAFAQNYVRGYTRANGTYVAPHYQSAPNSTKLDNYSTQGNNNPYSGQEGTVDPYRQTQSNPTGSPYNQPRRSSNSQAASSYDYGN
ncbi:hypothetical protein ACFQS6_22465 [Xanthomonas populi]|uniref:hypothetical protein n=1 Tax=Xanthomonas populi TaxID=53414 RepID=UPI001ABF4B75|nr:hypothetical protein [Xanthomonas populi]